MSTPELAVVEASHQAEPTLRLREKIDTIRQTVAKGASDAQLEMFLTLAERYQLDPFLKEIWFSTDIGIMTGRDGYLKIAMRHPDYDGIVSAAVREGDNFSLEPLVPTVKHSFGPKRGPVIGAYAVVYHKSRRPVICYADMIEYQKSGIVWNKYKSAMICKVAEVMALKRQFAISGLSTEEEVRTPSAAYVVENMVPDEEKLAPITSVPSALALAPEIPELTPIERIQEAMTDRVSIGNALQGLLSELIVKWDEEKAYLAYANILEDHGVTEWQNLKTRGDAKQVAAQLYELVHRTIDD